MAHTHLDVLVGPTVYRREITQLRGRFLRLRVRDRSVPALTEGTLPSGDTIPGAFIRNVEGRIAELEADGGEDAVAEAAELREVLRLGRLLLAGHEVTL